MTSELEIQDIEKIKNYYYDPKTGLGGIDKTYQHFRDKYTKEQIQEVIQKQNLNQITKPISDADLKSKFFKIVSEKNEYQADLMFFPEATKKVNNNFYIILNIISLASRMLYSYALKNKHSLTVNECFKDFLNKIKDRPDFDKCKRIVVDQGAEFHSGNLRAFLKENDVELIVINKEKTKSLQLSIVERVNKTLRDMINKYSLEFETNNWVNVLPDLVKNYNTSYHRTLGVDPLHVTEENVNERIANEIKYNNDMRNNYSYGVGDNVRIISKKQQVGGKGPKYVIKNKI